MAVQTFADVQYTPNSTPKVARARFGVRWITQLVPFQRSANVTTAPALM